MAKDSNTSFTDLADQAREMMATNPMVAPQMEQFWKAQDGILKEAEAFSEAWFQRRHEAAKTALDAVRDANGEGEAPPTAMRTMLDWQQHSLQRLAEDMQQWVELCSRCASRMTAAEVDAGKEGVEEVAKRAKSTTKKNASQV